MIYDVCSLLENMLLTVSGALFIVDENFDKFPFKSMLIHKQYLYSESFLSGPLTWENKHGKKYGKAYLVGVVSYGMECANPNFPGVYARVTSAIRWIRKESRKRYRCTQLENYMIYPFDVLC